MKEYKFLMTRPEYDATTRYLSRWSEGLLTIARKKGILILDLHKEKANLKEFTSMVSRMRPSLIVLNGHGNQGCVTGHDNEILVQEGKNTELLGGKITYAVSCQSATILGRAVVNKTGTTYIGYEDDFVFTFSQSKVGKPLENDRAKPFMEASNQVILSILKGHSAQEASQRSKEAFRAHIIRLLSSQANPDARLDAQALWWNLKNQICLGNGEKRFIE